jgi:SAM-dependent methyltransferase
MVVPSEGAEPSAVACPVCGGGGVSPWRRGSLRRELRPEDLAITDAGYGRTLPLLCCAACSFVFADPARLRDLTALYTELCDPEYEATQAARGRQMAWLLDQALAAHPTAATLLDVGAGAGALVAEARERGLQAVGVEPSRSLAAAAARLHDVTLVVGTLPHPNLAGRRFDVVALIDVVEHVGDPCALLCVAAAHLAPEGLLLLVTPDRGSLAARLLGRRWWHYRLAHVGYFDHPSLERVLGRAGLGVVTWRRARWHFPISYLGERLAVYLPIGRLLGWMRRVRPGRWLLSRTVTLDLRDSFLILARKVADATAPPEEAG